jgi:hypothetical protein
VDSGFSIMDVVFGFGIGRRTAFVRNAWDEVCLLDCLRCFYIAMVDVCGYE